MSESRFFIDTPLSRSVDAPVPVPLTDDDLHHALRVSRIRAGEYVVIVDSENTAWRVEVTRLDTHGMAGFAVAHDAALQVPIELVIFQGVPKAEKMDHIVRQCVEIGASRIVPVELSRTVVRLDDKKRRTRVERWRKIALSAAKQAGREAVPEIHEICDLGDAVGMVAQLDAVLVLWEECDTTSLGSAVSTALGRGARSIGLVIGPEGGIAPDEVAALQEAGCIPVSMGPFVMRTETAAVAAAAITMAVAFDHSSDA